MVANAKSLVDLRPDLIIFTSPHGLRLGNNFLFLANSKVTYPIPHVYKTQKNCQFFCISGKWECSMGWRMD